MNTQMAPVCLLAGLFILSLRNTRLTSVSKTLTSGKEHDGNVVWMGLFMRPHCYIFYVQGCCWSFIFSYFKFALKCCITSAAGTCCCSAPSTTAASQRALLQLAEAIHFEHEERLIKVQLRHHNTAFVNRDRTAANFLIPDNNVGSSSNRGRIPRFLQAAWQVLKPASFKGETSFCSPGVRMNY